MHLIIFLYNHFIHKKTLLHFFVNFTDLIAFEELGTGLGTHRALTFGLPGVGKKLTCIENDIQVMKSTCHPLFDKGNSIARSSD